MSTKLRRETYFRKKARLHCVHANGRSEVSRGQSKSTKQLRERSWRLRCSARANVFLQNLHWYEGAVWPSAGCLGSSVASAELIAIHATVYPASRTKHMVSFSASAGTPPRKPGSDQIILTRNLILDICYSKADSKMRALCAFNLSLQ